MSEQYDKRHGGPYDRGSAEAYYGRKFNPHYFKGDTYNSERIDRETDLTPEDIAAYTKGFQDTNDFGDFKDWG